MGSLVPAQREAAAVHEACATAANGDELLLRVDTALREAVPFDGATWFGTDPGTLLSTTPTRIEGIDAVHCDSFWHREFHVDDANLFRDLQRSAEPVASLRQITDDRPVRSARYREFLAPQGYDDELRAVFKVGDSTWGIAGLYRAKGRPAFDASDRAFVAGLATSIAIALRAQSAGCSVPWGTTAPAPGLMMFDLGGHLVSANAEADDWLDQISAGQALLSTDPAARSWLPPDIERSSGQRGLPPAVLALTAHARAVADGHEKGPARLRLRGRNGQWLVLHASRMSGDDGHVAVVVEPAKSSEVAPIIVEAYALSPRERDVVRCIARGMSSAEIAADLFLSPHTVRDYVKSVFEKVGVSSRGELVAKLFAEHYTEALHAGAVHVA
jgi:DNA-binding CsgD family transcriptional regulator